MICWDLLLEKAEYRVYVIVSKERKGLAESLRHMEDVLATVGCQAVFTISAHRTNWRGVFDLEKGFLRNLQVYDLSAFELGYGRWVTPVALDALNSLCTLTVDLDPSIDQYIAHWVQACPQLQELNISIQERHVLGQVNWALEVWRGRHNPLQLTLLERDNDGCGYIIT